MKKIPMTVEDVLIFKRMSWLADMAYLDADNADYKYMTLLTRDLNRIKNIFEKVKK